MPRVLAQGMSPAARAADIDQSDRDYIAQRQQRAKDGQPTKTGATSARSIRADVRNPLLQLPAAQRLADLPPEAQAALKALLIEIRDDCRVRAEECWRKHKAPMAAYWKATGVYANHTQRLLRGK